MLSLIAILLCSFQLEAGHKFLSTESLPISLRVSNAIVTYLKYIGKLLWPKDMAVLYPFPETIPASLTLVSLIVLLIITITAITLAGRAPYLIVGWLWYLGSLFPMSGIIQAGVWPEMADRWAYIPGIGIFIMVSWGSAEVLSKFSFKKFIFPSIAFIIIFIFIIVARNQVAFWKNSIALYDHTLMVTKNNPLTHNNLGIALYQAGRTNEAIIHFLKAIQIKPDYAKAHFNLGSALNEQGKTSEAIKYYSESLRFEPEYVDALNNLGTALDRQGKNMEAIAYFLKALDVMPGNIEAHNNLGNVFYRMGKMQKAIYHYSETIKTHPNTKDMHNNLGIAYIHTGNTDYAVKHFQEALRIDPGDIHLKKNLSNALKIQKQKQ